MRRGRPRNLVARLRPGCAIAALAHAAFAIAPVRSLCTPVILARFGSDTAPEYMNYMYNDSPSGVIPISSQYCLNSVRLAEDHVIGFTDGHGGPCFL
jgi:hypothetical protein